MDRRADAVVALLFAALGVAVAIGALTLPSSPLNRDAIGPAGLPLALASVLVVGGVIQALRSTLWYAGEGWVVPAEGAEDDPDHAASPLRPIAFMVGAFLYAVLLVPLGYLIVTPLAVGLGLWALRVRSPLLLGATVLGFTALSFLVFSEYLGVPIPTGILTDLLVDLGLIEAVR